ncbi:hypothetical protein GCK72_022135 [Caenorhabditis remanei]|uniref:non-specific serine/threonine protein kinase n=1 Tax=Caenorhabditis remanei TaxID=31234 RepID=A0A6A5FSX7_CAERE|nr:hypothetical protein GCK72_022135 [Caenorhabditis remanei]KAF1745688.1 hypothetical protein GCK72_022135 [Caenorhabditis remanei]
MESVEQPVNSCCPEHSEQKNENEDPKPRTLHHYKTISDVVIYHEHVGRGGTCEVRHGNIVINGNEVKVAVKLQNLSSKPASFYNEAAFYTQAKNWNDIGFPKMIKCGKDAHHRFIAVELLGQSLRKYHLKSGKQFNLRTILLLADQMITLIEKLHNHGYIHRDLKPDNFVMGPEGENSGLVYLIDFGHVEKYIDAEGFHKREECIHAITGTPNFMSISAHMGYQQSRKDDMMVLLLIFTHFFVGSFPWEHKKYPDQATRLREIGIEKQTSLGGLIKKMPAEFQAVYNAVEKLDFQETPDYEKYRRILRGLAAKNNYTYDFKYQWDKEYFF